MPTTLPPLHPRLDSPIPSIETSAEQLTVRGAIFRKDTTTTNNENNAGEWTLLILKRTTFESRAAAAANEPSRLADHWEIPGGGVEDSDGTLRSALGREVREETGLEVTGVWGEVEEMHFTTRRGRANVQFNYVVSVRTLGASSGDGTGGIGIGAGDEVRVTLCDEEHSEFRWVREREVDGFLMTEGMGKVIRNAFEWARTYMDESKPN